MPVRQVRRRVRYYSFAGRGGSGTTAVVRMGCMNVCGLPAERRPKTAKDGNRAASANTRTCRQGRRAQLSVCHSGRPCLRFHAWSRPLVSGMRALGMRRINSWVLVGITYSVCNNMYYIRTVLGSFLQPGFAIQGSCHIWGHFEPRETRPSLLRNQEASLKAST